MYSFKFIKNVMPKVGVAQQGILVSILLPAMLVAKQAAEMPKVARVIIEITLVSTRLHYLQMNRWRSLSNYQS